MEQWLIRTAQNFVAGPYTRDQVCQLVRDSQLSLQDEVCPANGYWFFLHETAEVKKFLGIQVRRAVGENGEEITETQTETTDPLHGAADDEGSVEVEEGPELAELPETLGEEQTSMLSNQALRRFQAPRNPPEAPRRAEVMGGSTMATSVSGERIEEASFPMIQVGTGASPGRSPAVPRSLPRVEKTSYWRGIAWALVAGVALTLYFILKLIRSGVRF